MIDLFGIEIPLEWFVPNVLALMIGFFFTYKWFRGKKAVISTLVGEFDKNGTVEPHLVANPTDEGPSFVSWYLPDGTKISKKHGIPFLFPASNGYQRVYLNARGTDRCVDPDAMYDGSAQVRGSLSGVVQEHTQLVAETRRGLLGLGTTKTTFLLVAVIGFMAWCFGIISDAGWLHLGH